MNFSQFNIHCYQLNYYLSGKVDYEDQVCKDNEYLIGNVRIWVKAEHFWNILKGHVDDVILILLDGPEIRQRITFVELEPGLKEGLEEPDVCESYQKTFVEIVCNSSPVLYLLHFKCRNRY